MLNLTKTKPWMVASLLVATSVFGQSNNNSCNPPCPPPKPACPPASCCKPCPPPRDPLPCPTVAAYNAPARIETRCPWDVWVDASFIYWQPYQENMEPAAALNADPTSYAVLGDGSTLTQGKVINQHTKFKPGFKVGLGMNFDHDSWDGHVEYTRFHSTHHTSAGVGSGVYVPMLLSNSVYNVFQVTGLAGSASVPVAFSEKWKLNMDLIDVEMGRMYWVGTHLTFYPTVGARGGWINQQLTASYTAYTITSVNAGTTASTTSVASALQKDKSTSWCIGPRMGIETNWMLGSWGCNTTCYDGFRFFGNGYADILYTRYNTREIGTVTATIVGVTSTLTEKFGQKRINTIRTHLDFEMGIGWGSYFDNNNWHIDLSAGYGFQVFFDQNMFRRGPIPTVGSNMMPLGNLYIQGLTATARLDF